MKIRNGFVSNSSSSSFIVAYKIPTCSDCNFNLEKFFKKSDPNITQILETGAAKIVTYYKTNFECFDEDEDEDDNDESFFSSEEGKELSNEMKSFEEKGYKIILLDVGYRDDTGKQLLRTYSEVLYKG